MNWTADFQRIGDVPSSNLSLFYKDEKSGRPCFELWSYSEVYVYIYTWQQLLMCLTTSCKLSSVSCSNKLLGGRIFFRPCFQNTICQPKSAAQPRSRQCMSMHHNLTTTSLDWSWTVALCRWFACHSAQLQYCQEPIKSQF